MSAGIVSSSPGARVALALLTLLISVMPAAADSFFYVVLRDQLQPFSVLFELPLGSDGLGPPTRQAVLPRNVIAGPVVSSDGRYVAMLITLDNAFLPARFAVFDGANGEVHAFEILSVFHGTLLADPSALRFFVVTDKFGITIIEPTGVRMVSIPTIGSEAVLSADGRDLFVPRADRPGLTEPPTHIAVLDPLTGTERRRLSVTPGLMALSRDGRELFIVGGSSEAAGATLRVVNTVTGAELRRRDGLATGLFESIGRIVLDERYARVFLDLRQQILAGGGGGGLQGRLLVLDASTLADRGTGGGVSNFILKTAPKRVTTHSHGEARSCSS